MVQPPPFTEAPSLSQSNVVALAVAAAAIVFVYFLLSKPRPRPPVAAPVHQPVATVFAPAPAPEPIDPVRQFRTVVEDRANLHFLDAAARARAQGIGGEIAHLLEVISPPKPAAPTAPKVE